MKKRKVTAFLTILTASVMIASLAGCGTTDKKVHVTGENAVSVSSVSEPEEAVATTSSSVSVKTEAPKQESDVSDFLSGMGDVYVEQGATSVDYAKDVYYDNAIVKDVKADDSKIDTSTPGEYTVTYQVTVNVPAYTAYQEVKGGSGAFEEAAKDVSDAKDQEATVKIEKTVTVVEPDKAQELADAGTVVKETGGTNKTKSDGSEVTAEVKAPASTEKTGGEAVNASTKEPVAAQPEESKDPETKTDSSEETKADGSTDNKDASSTQKDTNTSTTGADNNTTTDFKNTSGNASSGNKTSGNTSAGNKQSTPNQSTPKQSGNSSTNTKPAHVHNWVPVTKVVHHDAVTHEEPVYETQTIVDQQAYDETTPAYCLCKNCGYTSNDDMTMIDHCAETGHCYTVVPSQSVHHDAVTHTEQVQTGTRTVTDQAAYDETVTTGYRCSECGATK